jgi:DNA-binding response OmpR family regulator
MQAEATLSRQTYEVQFLTLRAIFEHSTGDAAKAKQMGADDYVVKGDTNMDAIIAKIKAFEH